MQKNYRITLSDSTCGIFFASDHITDRYSKTYRREISVYSGGGFSYPVFRAESIYVSNGAS